MSKTARADASVLIIEGWIPQYALELSYSEYINGDYSHIFTSGLKSPDYFLMAMNGRLIFYKPFKTDTDYPHKAHLVEIDARSEMYGSDAARFNVRVNDSLTAEFITDKRRKEYGFQWYGNINDIDSISIEFTNDKHGDFGDRNLYIRSITFDKNLVIPYQYNSVYDIGKPGGRNRRTNNSVSYAETARDRLLSIGLDSSEITAIPGERVSVNRTLSSVLAVRDYLQENATGIKSVNVVSLGAHSRRTWITYKYILGREYQTGIISLADRKTAASVKRRLLKTARESAALAFYCILLIFY
ncbi:MAG: carbohydrate-binding domain-containing protein [Bacteroidales bacterium]